MATKKVNGKNKGNAFERKIANILSERFKDYLGKDRAFRRNSDSGSFFGGSNHIRTEIYDTDFAIFGDLICPKAFNYSVECKHYKTAPQFATFLNGSITQWDLWISQAEQDSQKSNKKMLLIIKYNNVDEFVVLNEQCQSIRLCFTYKNKFIYMLKDFLSLDNSTFFS